MNSNQMFCFVKGLSAGLVAVKVRQTQQFSLSVNVAAGQTVALFLEYQEVLYRKLGKYAHSIYAKSQQQVSCMGYNTKNTEYDINMAFNPQGDELFQAVI